jgi:hypothetical protein
MLISGWLFLGCGHACGPVVAPVHGFRGSLAGAAQAGWSVQCGDFPELGKDFGKQFTTRWEAQSQLARVMDQPAGDVDEPVAKSGDHGLAAADTVSCQGFQGLSD